MRYARASASSSPRRDSDSADLADSVAPFTSRLETREGQSRDGRGGGGVLTDGERKPTHGGGGLRAERRDAATLGVRVGIVRRRRVGKNWSRPNSSKGRSTSAERFTASRWGPPHASAESRASGNSRDAHDALEKRGSAHRAASRDAPSAAARSRSGISTSPGVGTASPPSAPAYD